MRPMLAAKLEWSRVKYPVLVSPKLDGVRCIVDNGKPMSRTWKVLPNQHLGLLVAEAADELDLVDGELIVGPATAHNAYNASMSGVMSYSGAPNITYHVFDDITDPDAPYQVRRKSLKDRKLPAWVQVLPQYLCHTDQDVEKVEQICINMGFEGVIVRSPSGRYKFNRSTVNEGLLLKLKRFTDGEAVVIGTQELMHNDNEAFLDPRGFTARTSHQAGQTPGNMLGALICRTADGIIFNIGTGFTHQQRSALWKIKQSLEGKIVKYKSQPHGSLDAPRFPVFIGFRDPIDYGE